MAALAPAPRTRAWPLPLLVAALLLAPRAGAAQSTSLPCGRTATTLTSPFIGLVLNGQCIDLSGSVRRLDTTSPMWRAQLDQTFGAARVQLDVLFDADPFISFGATTTNILPGPITYAFLFGTPVVPGNYAAATSTGGVSVTAGNAGNTTVATGAVYPTFISGYGTVGLTATNLGVDLGTTPCIATTTTTCNYGTAANAFAPTFYDNMEALLTYTQNDAASVASWSGRVDLLTQQSVVPEPATLGLLAVGLLTLVGIGSLRPSQRATLGMTRRTRKSELH